MKKLLFLGVCLVALTSQPARAQAAGPEVVVVRIAVGSGALHMTVTRGPDKTEESQQDIPLNGFKHQKLVTEVYQQIAAKLMREGYTLKGMSGGDVYTTLIFTKGQ